MKIAARTCSGSAAGEPHAKFSVLAYLGTSNLGDAIQTAALSRLLDGQLYGIYRHAIHKSAATAYPFIINGWLADAPPAPGVFATLIFAGVFLGQRPSQQLKWLGQSSAPVGVRDPATRAVLASRGIASRLIGCATLTLPRYSGARFGRYAIDEFAPGTEFLTNQIDRRTPWHSQWNLAIQRLELLRTAELIHTSRLHIALPCLAFGTPVVIRRAARDRSFQPARFSILDEMGFEFDRPCVLDVTGWKSRYLSFLAESLGHPVTEDGYRRPLLVDNPEPNG